jgi:hypothetical protein
MVPVAYTVLNWLFYEISLNLLCLVHHDLTILWNESDGPVFLSESKLRKISLSIQNNMNTHTSENIDNFYSIIQIVYMYIGKEIVNDNTSTKMLVRYSFVNLKRIFLMVVKLYKNTQMITYIYS